MAHIDVDTARAAELVLKKMGRAVVYKRGALSATLTAARGRTPSADAEEERFLTSPDRARWLVKLSTLTFGGVQAMPREGDMIEESNGSQLFRYEVLHAGPSKHWDYFDTGRQYIWIRTKELSNSEVEIVIPDALPVSMQRQFDFLPLTMAQGAAATTSLDLSQMAWGSVQFPPAIDGTLKWQVSVDGVSWTDSFLQPFVANVSVKIPDEVGSFPFLRFAASTVQSATRTFTAFAKG